MMHTTRTGTCNMVKFLVSFALLLAPQLLGGSAFVVVRKCNGSSPAAVCRVAQQQQRSIHHPPLAAAAAAVALEPEPAGGIELSSGTSIASCRVKQLEEAPSVKSEGAFQFWMTAPAEGKLIQEIRSTILKDAAKKANFPGFRKGQVPPYAQPQITQFAVQEAIIKTVEATVNAYGLKSLPGSDGEVKVHEDVASLAKAYKTGDSVQFTATLNASYDEERKPKAFADVIVDVAAAVVDELKVETAVVDELKIQTAVVDELKVENEA